MDKSIKIIIAESSEIIKKGFLDILNSSKYDIQFVNSLEEISNYKTKYPIDLILINPVLVQNESNTYLKIVSGFKGTKWIGIVYSYFDKKFLETLDDLIFINDSSKIINKKITNLIRHKKTNIRSVISEREIDVLKLLVEGNSNKEIANNLCISTHTVITHRKNIIRKTGIKSVPGLTIYAMVNKVITLDHFQE